MSVITLSPDQEIALDTLFRGVMQGKRKLVLTGPAGSGKSTIVDMLEDRLMEASRPVAYMAPTGKAANRLREIMSLREGRSPRPVATVHSRLYRGVSQKDDGGVVFYNPVQICMGGEVLICDESSMVDTVLDRAIEDNLPPGSNLIYVGDREQLPPVSGKGWGPDFDNPDAVLTEIHRQSKGNPILRISAAVRQGGKLPEQSVEPFYVRRRGSLSDVAAWAVEQMEAGIDVAVICFTNKSVAGLNRLIRMMMGYRELGPVVVGEKLLCRHNNKDLGWMNGEALTVLGIEGTFGEMWNGRYPPGSVARKHAEQWYGDVGPEQMASLRLRLSGAGLDHGKAWIQPGLIGTKYGDHFYPFSKQLRALTYKHYLHVDYGYAITYHRSQGSQWPLVALVLDDTMEWRAKQGAQNADTIRRMVYTGITRTRDKAWVWDTRRRG